jgi:predicted DNA binding CopG/RHH family protein
MPNTKKAKAAKLPRHWSEAKNEAEEAAWWDKNAARLTREAAQRGALKTGTLEQLLADMKKAQREHTRPLSLRIPHSDIELAKAQAEQKGLGYQTYLKSLLHQALINADLMPPKTRTAGGRSA